nr:neurofilament medium polypeptide-like [Penaeus vannamei]
MCSVKSVVVISTKEDYTVKLSNHKTRHPYGHQCNVSASPARGGILIARAILELKEDIKNTPRPVLARRQPESLDLLCPEDASKVDGKVAQIECLHAVLLEQRRLVEVERHYFAIFAGLATATLAAVAALIFLNRKLKQASLETRLVTLQDEKKPEIAEAQEDEESEEAEALEDEESEVSESQEDEESEVSESQEDEESEVSESQEDEESEEAEALEDEESEPKEDEESEVSESQEDEESEEAEGKEDEESEAPNREDEESEGIPGGPKEPKPNPRG